MSAGQGVGRGRRRGGEIREARPRAAGARSGWASHSPMDPRREATVEGRASDDRPVASEIRTAPCRCSSGTPDARRSEYRVEKQHLPGRPSDANGWGNGWSASDAGFRRKPSPPRERSGHDEERSPSVPSQSPPLTGPVRTISVWARSSRRSLPGLQETVDPSMSRQERDGAEGRVGTMILDQPIAGADLKTPWRSVTCLWSCTSDADPDPQARVVTAAWF